jgi:copper chaperone CopZ
METLDVPVPTVHCHSCMLSIREALDELQGVAGSDVDLDAKRVTITYDPDSVDEAEIVAAIEQAGYPTEA